MSILERIQEAAYQGEHMGRPAVPPRLPEQEERPSFPHLVDRYLPVVLRSIRRMGVQAADCEDVAQDTCLAILAALPTYDPTRPGTSPEKWVKGIARNMARNHLKVRRRRLDQADIEHAPDLLDGAPLADVRLVHAEAREQAIALLDALPLERRQVFVMSFYDELTMPEISAELGIPLDTGYTRLRLARQDLEGAWHRRRIAEQRKEAASAVPFALAAFNLDALLAAEHPVPPADPSMHARLWSRLAELIGPAALAGVIPVALSAGKVAAGISAKIAVGGLLALLAGAGIDELVRAVLHDPSPGIVAIAVAEGRPAVGESALVAAASTGTMAAIVPGASASEDHPTQPDAGPPAVLDSLDAERLLLQNARKKLNPQKPDAAAAVRLLERHKREFKHPHFATERDELLQRARALLDQGAPHRSDAGTP